MHDMQDDGKKGSRHWINGSMIDEDDYEGPSDESDDVQNNVRKDTLERELEEIDKNFDKSIILKQSVSGQQF